MGHALNLFDYLDNIPRLLSSPYGVVALAALAAFLAFVMFHRYGVYAAIGFMLLAGICTQELGGSELRAAMIAPIEAFRGVSKALFVLVGFVLATRTLLIEGKSGKPVNAAVACWVLLQAIYATRLAIAGAWDRAFLNLTYSPVLAIGIAGSLVRVVREIRDMHKLFWSLEGAGLIFCGLSLLQWVVNPISVVQNGRMLGLSENPQFAGVLMSTLVCICTYLALSKTEGTKLRLWHTGCLVIFGMFMIWTGSRTAVLITAVGLLIQLRGALWGWIGLAVVAYITYTLFGHLIGNEGVLARLVSTQDTRLQVWHNAWVAFKANLVLGDGKTLMESSYLSTAASMGLVGLMALAAIIYTHGRTVIYVFVNRDWLGDDRRLPSLILALTLALAAGAGFEAFLLAIASHAIVTLLALLAVTEIAREKIDAAKYAGVPLSYSDALEYSGGALAGA